MKTKLGYLCSSVSWGGLEMNHLRNASWMQERGHDVVVICIKNSPIDQRAAEMQLPAIHIEKHKKYYDFGKARALQQIIQKNSITHLLIRSTLDVSIAANVKRKLGDALHTSYFMEMQIGVKKTNPLHTLRFRYIDLWSCPLVWLKNQVEELTNFKNELIVIPSGVDLSQFQNMPDSSVSRKALNLPEKPFLFGLIGRFDPQKGQMLLLEAMSKTQKHDFHVVLLGEPTLHEGNSYYEQMEAIIKERKLEDRVHIRPFRKDAETFYNAIDCLVMATKAETFGMVTVEALASGRPVLGSNAGGTPEILQNQTGGRLFTSMDADDMATQIDDLLGSNVQFSPNTLRKIANVYDHHKVCEQVENALNIQ